MSFPQGGSLYSAAFGSRPENVEVPTIQTRVPAVTDTIYPIGKRWIIPNVGEYVLVGQTSVGGVLQSTWSVSGAASGALNTLTADSGGPISPSAGNITLSGTGNQITTTGSGSTITASIPATFVAPGSIASTSTITAGTGLTVTSGNLTLTNGNLVFGTAGNKIVSNNVGTTTAAGANSFGTVTLVGGTATVATTAVTANSIIQLTRQSVGATGAAALGEISKGTVVAGTSFVINAWTQTNATTLQTTDVSSIGWMIVN